MRLGKAKNSSLLIVLFLALLITLNMSMAYAQMYLTYYPVRNNTSIGGSALWNATIVPNNIGPQVYNNATNDLFGGGDFTNINVDAFLGDIVIPFTLSYGPFFWAMLFGAIALIMFMKQENAVIPVLLTIIGGVPIVLSPYLPLDWQKFIGVLVVLVIASILYVLKRKR